MEELSPLLLSLPQHQIRSISATGREVRIVIESVLKGNRSKAANPVTRNELNNHTDTCCAGANCVVLSQTGPKVNVREFNNKSRVSDVNIDSVAYASNSTSGETFIIIVNEALLFVDVMEYSLLSTTQLRSNDIKVDDTPRIFDSTKTHSLTAPMLLPDDMVSQEMVNIPLRLRGPFSFFDARKPTTGEMQNSRKLVLTDGHP